MTTVSAFEFQKNFGDFKEVAQREPLNNPIKSKGIR